MKRLPYPRDIFYDEFRKELQSGIKSGTTSHEVSQIAHELHLPQLAANRIYTRMISMLDQSRVYVLTREALECVLDTAIRMRHHTIALAPIAPVLPMWVEFENCTVATMDADLHAVWCVPDLLLAESSVGSPGSFITIQYAQPHTPSAQTATGSVSDGAVIMPDFFTRADQYSYGWDAGTRAWHLMRSVPACPRAHECPLARRDVHDGVLTIVSDRDAFPATDSQCICFEMGVQWTLLLYVLFAMLQAEGAEHTSIDRRLRTPRHDGHRTAFEKRLQADYDAWNTNHPMYTRVSLSQRTHVRREQTPDGPALHYENTDESHITKVARHPRFLIPGPGKPWRGDVPRIVFVAGHNRHVHGHRRLRYHVVP